MLRVHTIVLLTLRVRLCGRLCDDITAERDEYFERADLGALVHQKSKLEVLPEGMLNDRKAYCFRVSDTITPPMDIYFDRETKRLSYINWRSDQHVFSDWKEIDGVAYPSKCIGYKINDKKQWCRTEILELERLTELPKELSRAE